MMNDGMHQDMADKINEIMVGTEWSLICLLPGAFIPLNYQIAGELNNKQEKARAQFSRGDEAASSDPNWKPAQR